MAAQVNGNSPTTPPSPRKSSARLLNRTPKKAGAGLHSPQKVMSEKFNANGQTTPTRSSARRLTRTSTSTPRRTSARVKIPTKKQEMYYNLCSDTSPSCEESSPTPPKTSKSGVQPKPKPSERIMGAEVNGNVLGQTTPQTPTKSSVRLQNRTPVNGSPPTSSKRRSRMYKSISLSPRKIVAATVNGNDQTTPPTPTKSSARLQNRSLKIGSPSTPSKKRTRMSIGVYPQTIKITARVSGSGQTTPATPTKTSARLNITPKNRSPSTLLKGSSRMSTNMSPQKVTAAQINGSGSTTPSIRTSARLLNRTPKTEPPSTPTSWPSRKSARRRIPIEKPEFYNKLDFSDTSSEESSLSPPKIPKSAAKPTPSPKTPLLRKTPVKKPEICNKLNIRDTSSEESLPPPKTPKSVAKPMPSPRTPSVRSGFALGNKSIKCPVPCRENEFDQIWNFIKSNLEASESSCLYVSGVPGTGKTLVVNAVLKVLDDLAKQQKSNSEDFKHVYINGLSLSNPNKIWSRFYQAIIGEKVHLNPTKALGALEKHFKSKHVPVILILDELDQLLDKQQNILYTLFEWSSNNSALLSFIAIFNTINLPEQALTLRNISRAGLDRVVFSAYKDEQLKRIIRHYLGDEKCDKLKGDCLNLISKKVAAVSGDARRALEISKRTLEIMERQPNISGVKAVQETFKELFSAPKIQAIESCSSLEQDILRAIASDCQNLGKDETSMNRIVSSVRGACLLDGFKWSIDQILHAASRLYACKLIILENQKPTMYKKVMLNVPIEDINFVFNINAESKED